MNWPGKVVDYGYAQKVYKAADLESEHVYVDPGTEFSFNGEAVQERFGAHFYVIESPSEYAGMYIQSAHSDMKKPSQFHISQTRLKALKEKREARIAMWKSGVNPNTVKE